MATIYVDSAAAGLADGTSWTDAYTTIVAAIAANSGGDVYRVASGHSEGSAVDLDMAFESVATTPDQVISTNTSDDSYLKGAILNTTGDQDVRVTGRVTMYGCALKSNTVTGGSGSNSDIYLSSGADEEQKYYDCDFVINSTSSAAIMNFGNGNGSTVTLYNCRYSQAGTDPYSQITGTFHWRGGSIISGSAAPAGFFRANIRAAVAYIEGVDFTNFGTTWDINDDQLGALTLWMKNCKLAGSWAGEYVLSNVAKAGNKIVLENCGSVDVNYSYVERRPSGSIDHQTALYSSGTTGALHNAAAVPLSYKMASSTECVLFGQHLETPKLILYNETTTSQTFTIEFIHNESAALQDDEVWIEASYLGTSGSQIATYITDSYDDPFGTVNPYATPANQATSTVAWDEGLTERADSTVYVAGDFVKSSGSAGSAFICTVGGTSDSSVPAGFTGASDGDSITDNTVTWKAMRRQKCSVTITAAEQGVVSTRLILAKPSTTIWSSGKLGVS